MRCLRVRNKRLHLHCPCEGNSRCKIVRPHEHAIMPIFAFKSKRTGTPLLHAPKPCRTRVSMASRASSTAIRPSYSIAAPGLLFAGPYVSKYSKMSTQEQVVNSNLEYSDSEYEDDEEVYHEPLSPTTTSIAFGRRQSHTQAATNASNKQDKSLYWRDSALYGQGTDDTGEYLRRNGFNLRYSVGTGSSESYAPPTETSVSSATSDFIQDLLPQSSLRGRTLFQSTGTRDCGGEYLPLQSISTPKHRLHHATTQAKLEQSQESMGLSDRMGKWSPLSDGLAPLPLDILSITAARRNASTRKSKISNAVRMASPKSGPSRSSIHQGKPSPLDAIDSDTDEEELLFGLSKQSKRDPRPTQSIISVTDLRPAQATRNPSHILRFQVLPNQPSLLRTAQSTQEFSTGYSSGKYITDTRLPMSTTALPLQAPAKKKGSKAAVRGFFCRCKETIMGHDWK
jgi:hypothetical protein